jgi:cation-transporting ATPase F
MTETLWHSINPQEVRSILKTNVREGLSGDEAAIRLHNTGPNTITKSARKSRILMFLSQFKNPLVIVLLGASAVTFALRDFIDTSVILAVVIVNAIIGFVQEEKAEKAIESLEKMLKVECTVVRDGVTRKIAAEELVPGDVVLLQGGDKVPADLRIVEERNLHVDKSILTGESAPVAKSSEPVKPEDPVSDRTCMAYSGTLVTAGSGRCVVVATGDATELGKISGLIASASEISTPLTRKLAKFGNWLSVAVLGISALAFGLGVAVGRDVKETFSAAVAIAVAMIPEGLPAILTIVLAVGVKRMADRHAIIRTLPSVETLGSVTVICSDKTGTLTANEMTVRRVYAGGEEYEFGGIGYDPRSTSEIAVVDADRSKLKCDALVECLRCGLLCNESDLILRDDLWTPVGDPTEVALITAAVKAGLDPNTERELRPRIDVLPFESSNMFMATLHDSPCGERTIYLKGSLERVLEMCTNGMCEPEPKPLDFQRIRDRADDLARQGYRILAFAAKHVPHETDSVGIRDLSGMNFLGIQAMSDPARPEAVAAVRECAEAGVEVKMITGDHVSTARAIARDMGIGGIDPQSVTGSDLAEMDEEQFACTARSASVFARVAPEQKYRLVEALQSAGEIVAMTGDGVNDAPALKKADIGVAMGRAGSDVAKDASDMVLTDDNFASIVAAIEEGRTVLSNLLKTLAYILPTNLGEGMIIIVALLAGYALPITPVQLLWINTVTTITLSLPLAFEPREPGIMQSPPRRPDAPIISVPIIIRIVTVGFYMVAAVFVLHLWEQSMGASVSEARTAAVSTIVAIEAFYLLQARSERVPVWKVPLFTNPYIWVGVLAVVLLQLAFVYLPTMGMFFGTSPLSANIWLRIMLAAAPVLVVVSIERTLVKRFVRTDEYVSSDRPVCR